MANALEHGVRLSQISPKYLHSNSTSHTWVFSAFAELIDNAYDPDVAATQLFIDKKSIQTDMCLVFTDNGNGMVPEKLYKMLSFGFCDKVMVNRHQPIGQYGNGFKSGSMRLGKDAIVLTKCADSMSVGFLSQTYLANIKAETVLTPIVTWDRESKQLVERNDTQGSLEAITKHSLFRSEEALLMELEAMVKSDTGTCIIIYNLERTSDGNFELDFESNPTDILNPERFEIDDSTNTRPVRDYQPEYRRSLREYCSILFLTPRMKITLCGKKVVTKLMSKSLRRKECYSYKPRLTGKDVDIRRLDKEVKITFGFGSLDRDDGMMMYHRNRLIKAFEKVGVQKRRTGEGQGVIGIVEVNFLEPIHNKQDFNKTDKYNACINALGQKLNDYWQKNNTEGTGSSDKLLETPRTWAQCDKCDKWRRLPAGYSDKDLSEEWFCCMNPDVQYSKCDVDQEPSDEDEDPRPTSKKTRTYKQRKEKMHKGSCLEEKERELTMRERDVQNKEQRLMTMAECRDEEQPENQQHVRPETTNSGREESRGQKRSTSEPINTSKKPRIVMTTDEVAMDQNSDSKDDDDDDVVIMDASGLDKPRRNQSDDVKPDKDQLDRDISNKGEGRSVGVKNTSPLPRLEQQAFNPVAPPTALNMQQQKVNTKLETELKDTKEELKDTKEELKHTKEELTHTKEELKDTKEELKHTKEELKDTKEELTHTKEELTHTKEELKDTKEKLSPLRKNVSLLLQLTMPELNINEDTVIDGIVATLIKGEGEERSIESSGQEMDSQQEQEKSPETIEATKSPATIQATTSPSPETMVATKSPEAVGLNRTSDEKFLCSPAVAKASESPSLGASVSSDVTPSSSVPIDDDDSNAERRATQSFVVESESQGFGTQTQEFNHGQETCPFDSGMPVFSPRADEDNDGEIDENTLLSPSTD